MKNTNQSHLHLVRADKPVKLYNPSYAEDQEPLYGPAVNCALRKEARKLNGFCYTAVISILAMVVTMFLGLNTLESVLGFACTLTLIFVCLFITIPLTFVVVAASNVAERLKQISNGQVYDLDYEWEDDE